MSITVDKIQLEIAIKHDKARQEIADITKQLQGETKQLKDLDQAKRKAMKKYKDESHPEVIKATQAYEAQSKKIDELRARKNQLRASLKVEGLSIAELRDELKKYNLLLSNLTPGTEKFNETKQHVDELKERLKELQTTTSETQGSLGKFGSGLLGKLTGGIDIGQLKTFLAGNAITGVVTTGLELVADLMSKQEPKKKPWKRKKNFFVRMGEGDVTYPGYTVHND